MQKKGRKGQKGSKRVKKGQKGSKRVKKVKIDQKISQKKVLKNLPRTRNNKSVLEIKKCV